LAKNQQKIEFSITMIHQIKLITKNFLPDYKEISSSSSFFEESSSEIDINDDLTTS